MHEWFVYNFQAWNIRNVWCARDDGHHHDVKSKFCGVTLTTRLVEWTLSISEINVFFSCFQELTGLKNTNGYQTKVWDKSKTTWSVGGGGGKNASTDFYPHHEPSYELRFAIILGSHKGPYAWFLCSKCLAQVFWTELTML